MDMTQPLDKVVLATRNPGKVREIGNSLAALPWQLAALSDFEISEVAETGLSFVENAIIKARHAALHTKLPVIADDSGLEVQALQGKPGIYSARFAGEGASDQQNIAKLLESLKDVAPQQRQARFVCVIVMMLTPDDPTPLICQGSLHGEILLEATGSDGFGYDPIFWLPGRDCSLAEIPLVEKNRISHRGVALQQLIKEGHAQIR